MCRNWCRYNNWKLNQVRRQELDRSFEDGELCIICLQSRRGSAFMPCGHLVCCVRCAQNVQDINPKCPMCRHDIDGILRVYETWTVSGALCLINIHSPNKVNLDILHQIWSLDLHIYVTMHMQWNLYLRNWLSIL